MRIVVDMQGVQSLSRYRGIGRYSDSFVKAFIETAKEHEIILLFNGIYDEDSFGIYKEYQKLIPQNRIFVFDGVAPTKYKDLNNRWNIRVSQNLREEFIYNLSPDWLIITSLFEGLEDNSVLSIGTRRDIKTAVIFYDLIPLIYPERFLVNEAMKEWYYNKIEYLKRANLLLAISNSAKLEAKSYLGSEIEIATIFAAVSSKFCVGSVDKEVLKRYGIDKEYIMLSSAYEPRKNFEGLIEAFKLLPKKLQERYKLVLVSNIPPRYRKKIIKLIEEFDLGNSVVLTGYVNDYELLNLYRGATLFVFPSLHEGFGLPPLEAMSCGVATIVSDCSSMPEVIENPEALFDPYNVADIADKIEKYLSNIELLDSLREHGLKQAKKFSWNRSAKLALDAIESFSLRPKYLHSYTKPYNKEYIFEHELISATSKRVFSRALSAVRKNEDRLKSLKRVIKRWRVEGPFDSSYSLALLNKESALALEKLGIEVVLHSSEGGGDFEPNKEFLNSNPEILAMYKKSKLYSQLEVDCLSRNLYPPRVEDMSACINMLHHYAWEESGFLLDWVDSFNYSLDGMTTLSNHVQKIMIDHGVTVPLITSGCGVDHWLKIEPAKPPQIYDSHFEHLRGFRFLHVSSCFPRKGVDVLLKAYVNSFSKYDDVSLIIKTFPNPHNEILKWREEAVKGVEDPPHILIIQKDLTQGELKSLYNMCNVFVAPSRAEGFGLPIAEAILSDMAVVTTAWGGQLDFCDDTTSWLIDYKFEYAKTHFNIFDSVWAEPDIENLAMIMKSLYHMPKEKIKQKTDTAKARLLKDFKWIDVSRRVLEHANTLPRLFKPSIDHIGWVSSYNTRCGIADYSKHLIENLNKRVTVFASYDEDTISFDSKDTIRCWQSGDGGDLSLLLKEIISSNIEVIVIQFNYSFFDFGEFRYLLRELHKNSKIVIVMMHSTTDAPSTPHKKLFMLKEELKGCKRVLVHTPSDMNRLKDIGIIDNVTLFPHAILDTDTKWNPNNSDVPLLMSYGFALPNKGLEELLESALILKKRGIDFKLLMMNAEYPLDISKELIDKIKRKIVDYGLGGVVEFDSTYYSTQESLQRLSKASLVIFPYQNTGESSSAAVRYAIAAGSMVAVTPLPIFEDLHSSVFKLSSTTPEGMAKSIEDILSSIKSNSTQFNKIVQEANRWRESHRYSIIAKRLSNMLTALYMQDRG